MRGYIVIAVAFAGLSTAAAYAAEGNGDPFPGPNAAVMSQSAGVKLTMGDDDPFDYHSPRTTLSMQNYRQAAPQSQNPFPYSPTRLTLNERPYAPSAIARTWTPRERSPATHG